jgi:predicted Rossmann fold flavoprotein
MQFDVIVIGAGAAGMMCAAQAGQRGRRVLLIDHVTKIGERIRISGGGRCNFTNRSAGAENFLSQNPHFCHSALARFSARDFVAMVERRRIRYEERDHGQLFCLDTAQDIIDLLKAECAAGQVQWKAPCAVSGIEAGASGNNARYNVATDAGKFACASVVIASGGLAAPKIGATPFGYRVAEQFCLKVIPPKPALVPLALAPETFANLQPLAGIAFAAAAECAGEEGNTRFVENMLITHRGLSGPAILQISSYWQMQEYRPQEKKQPIHLDLLPDLDAVAWLAANRHQKTLLHNLLAEHLPRRFAQEWCSLHRWDKPLNEFSNREIDAAAQALKRWALMPSGTLGYNKAEVTLGGVDTDGLSSKTMEAKTSPGLYFIGECVDVTGWLGGYNFQWAWSSGWVAGQFA